MGDLKSCRVNVAWEWTEAPHKPAATYHAGNWWPVLESGIGGVKPVRLTRWGTFSSHNAAFEQAREVVLGMLLAINTRLEDSQPETMM